MTPRALFPTLLLISAAAPQDSTPILLSNEVSICHGDDSDAPGCVTPLRRTYDPDPEPPKDERKTRHPGAVSLPLSPEFDEAAVDAVKKWKSRPAIKDAKPVATKVNVYVSFHLY
jgi:hypothetical protein